MFNFAKIMGFDSGIEMSDFSHNKEGQEAEDELWYNKLFIQGYK